MFTLYAALVLFTTTKVSSLLDDDKEWKEVKDPRIITFDISENSTERRAHQNSLLERELSDC